MGEYTFPKLKTLEKCIHVIREGSFTHAIKIRDATITI